MRKYRKYVVGFDQDDQTIYGCNKGVDDKWIDPLSKKEAEAMCKEMIEDNNT
jgi:hypothetical protein